MMGILARIPSEHPLQVSRLVIEGLAVRCFDAKHLRYRYSRTAKSVPAGGGSRRSLCFNKEKGEFDRVVVRRISREVLEPHASD